MFRVVFLKKAIKDLKRIPTKDLILEVCKSLSYFPNVQNVKKLVNHKYEYRLRVGKYRILFNVKEEIEIVEIHEVKNRDERTY